MTNEQNNANSVCCEVCGKCGTEEEIPLIIEGKRHCEDCALDLYAEK